MLIKKKVQLDVDVRSYAIPPFLFIREER